MNIRNIYHKFLGDNKRSALIKKNIFIMFFLKALYVLFYLLLVRLTLQCLGVYNNGLWMAISTSLIWIDNLDIGLGNGLRNKLADYVARNDYQKAKECVSSTFFMLIAIIIPVALLLVLILNHIDLYSILDVSRSLVPNLDSVIIVSTCLVCATFIFKFIGNIYYALQLPAVSQGLIVCGQALILVGTFLMVLIGRSSLMAIAVLNTVSPLIVYLCAYPITFSKLHPELSPSIKYFRKEMVKGLLSLGIEFFIIQIASAVLVLTSSVIVSHLFSPSMVTPYQIAYKYFNLTIMVFTVIATPFWSATTDAYAKGEIDWIKNSMRKIQKILIGLVFLDLLLVAVAKPIYHLWINNDDVTIPTSLSLLMAAYSLIICISSAYSFFLNGFGKLRIQIIFTCLAAILFVPLAFFLGKEIGINGITLSLCIVYIPGLVANMIQYNLLIKGKAKGIWNK